MTDNLTKEQEFRLFHNLEMAKLIRAMKEKFGEEAEQVVAKLNGEKVKQEWKAIAENSESNAIDDLICYLWEPLRKEGFEYEVCKTENGVQIKCTSCPIYDLAKHLGITDEAFYMFCESDPYITEGFNPNIGFERTKTLMRGDDCCDHFYYYKNKSK